MNLTPETLRLPTRYRRDVRPYSYDILRTVAMVLAHCGIVGDGFVTEGYEGLPADRERAANCDVGYYVRGSGDGPVRLVRAIGIDRASANIAAVVELARMVDPLFVYEAP